MPKGNLYSLPVSLPTAKLPKGFDLATIAEKFRTAFARIDDGSIDHQLHPEAVWRDTFALTGTLRTFYSADGIYQAWKGATAIGNKPDLESFRPVPHGAQLVELPNGSSWVELSYTFDIQLANGLRGKGLAMLSLVPRSSKAAAEGKAGFLRIWVMRTILDQIENYPNLDTYQPAMNVAGEKNTALNGGQDQSSVSQSDSMIQTDAVVVGGGQAGLSVAGRLQALNIPYILIDKYQSIGDSWKNRYTSTRLHTPREFSHLPFDRTFPDTYQEWLTKDDLAKGYQDWTRKYGTDQHIWQGTELNSGTWSDSSKEWLLHITKHGKKLDVSCKFVVMATGARGHIPRMPDFPNKELYKGLVMHSAEYKSADEWSGKRAIVIGTANTAHDIADDLYEAGLSSVTMTQRSRTYVFPREHWKAISDQTFNAEFPTALADHLMNTGPTAVSRLIAMAVLHLMAANETHRYEALERVGFRVEQYGDIIWNLTEGFGGHYLDIGTSQKVADGKIKVKSDAQIKSFTPDGLAFSDESEIAADVIIFATGFEDNMRNEVRKYFGSDVASQIEDFFGVDNEGEIRGVWKLQHPGLICHGWGMGQARYFSRYIALQIKAALDGKPLQVYSDTPVPPVRT